MSSSLSPWIRDYIVEIAETYGDNISDVPLYIKTKKVQITKFFTYGSESEDTHVWAEVSDKKHLIPLKITKKAVSEYRQSAAGQRVTQHVGAIVSIKNFKIISIPLPTTPPGRFTVHPGLALECTYIEVLGSSKESIFGNPESISNVHDIQLWSDGLNNGGGAGNVLRERKGQQEPQVVSDVVGVQPGTLQLNPWNISASVDDNSDAHITRHNTADHSMTLYKAIWQTVSKNPDYSRYSPSGPELNSPLILAGDTSDKNEVDRSPVDETADMEEDMPDCDNRSGTGSPISGWEPSPGPNIVEGSSAPTPGQRQPTPMSATPMEQLSSYPSVKETPLENKTKTSATRRKIPRPVSPSPPKQSGPERILAPNSDTSGSQSQGVNEPRMRREGHEPWWKGVHVEMNEIMTRTAGRLRT